METSASTSADNESKRKKIYLITGVILLSIVLIVIVVVLVVVYTAKDDTDSLQLTTSQKFDDVVFEIITDCAEIMQSSDANASCDTITESQRETMKEVFDEFNVDNDNEWSFAEFESFFMDTGDPGSLFDEMDTDDDGELDFVEVMASLKVQSGITPQILADTYAADIEQGYNLSFDLTDWTWFAYAADLLLYEEFGSVYNGYPNGINKEDWMNISCNREFEYLDTDDNGEQDIDLDEFIENAFTGFGIEYVVTRANITLMYNHEDVEESDIEAIVASINAAEDWKAAPGLSNTTNTTNTRRRLLWRPFSKTKKDDDKCGDGAMTNSNACASTDPSRRKGRSKSKGCGNTSTELMACKRKKCQESGKTEEQCRQEFANT